MTPPTIPRGEQESGEEQRTNLYKQTKAPNTLRRA